TPEQRWILELKDVLALRLECVKCGVCVVTKPSEWRDTPMECPGCRNHWELPLARGMGVTPMQHIGIGLRLLGEQIAEAKKEGGGPPFSVGFEIADPASSRWNS